MLRFEHPQVGELRLNRERLLVGGTDNIMLVIHHPDTGTNAERKLALLASATTTQTRAASSSIASTRPTS